MLKAAFAVLCGAASLAYEIAPSVASARSYDLRLLLPESSAVAERGDARDSEPGSSAGTNTAASASGAGSIAIRPYVAIRAEGAIYDKSDQGPNLEITNPSQFPFEHFAIGADIGPHWGAELAVDFVETNVGVPGLTERLGEYATWSIMPQVRYRYPVLNQKLVPYVVGGAGIGIGEFNDRNALHTDVQFGGSQDISFIAALGAGLEYYVNDNIAFGVEARHIFGQDHDITYLGQSRKLEMDQTIFSVGFRVYLDNPSAGDPRVTSEVPSSYSQAGTFDTQFRIGGAIFTNPDNFTPAEIQSPKRTVFGAGIGYSFNDHWGIELGGDYWEPDMHAPGVGTVAEYALWTLITHVRYRFKVGNGRIVPYALAGGGLGWAQINDRRVTSDVYPLVNETHTSVVGSVGGGIEYMLNRNAAVGVESRYIFAFDNDVVVGSTKGTLDNSSLLFLAQFRLLFP